MAKKNIKVTTPKVKVTLPKLNINTPDVSMKNIKKTVSNVNDFVYETSEDMVDVAIARTGQWQEVSEKAIKGGLKLAVVQQDVIFTALETVKGSLLDNKDRFKAFFSKN